MSVHSVQCRCGRFMSNCYAMFGGERLLHVRGTCSRCGENSDALHSPEAWWWNADVWDTD